MRCRGDRSGSCRRKSCRRGSRRWSRNRRRWSHRSGGRLGGRSTGLGRQLPGSRLWGAFPGFRGRTASSSMLRRERLADLANDWRLDGRGRRPDELALCFQMTEQSLALDSELFRELVDPDLSHVSPRLWPGVRDETRAIVSAGYCSSLSTHRVLISVKPAFAVRNLLNCLLRDGADSVDDGLFVDVDVYAHGRHLKEGFDAQSPPERLSPNCEIETLRCRVKPSATPWQPEPRIGNDPGSVLTSDAALRNYSQQC